MNYEEKIKKKLEKLNLSYDNYYLVELNNKKYIGFFYIKKKIKYLLKFSFDDFNSNLFNNEAQSYKFLKNRSVHFKIVNFQNILKDKDCYISKINYVDGNNGKYFELKDFFIKDKFKHYPIKIDKYFTILKSNFKNIYNYDLKKDKDFKKILEKFKNQKLNITLSHGDFVPWNSIKNFKVKRIYDLEYFSKKRIFIYDILHWLICPVTNKLKYLNYNLNYNKILIYYIKFNLKILDIKLDNNQLLMYILFYFYEQKYFFLQAKNINKKYKIISSLNSKNSNKLFKFYSNQIKIFLNY